MSMPCEPAIWPTGAIDRALLYIQWGPSYRNPDGTAKYFENPTPVLHFQFPTGVADVEIIPESAKLNVNQARPEEIRNLLLLVGVVPPQADAITAAILDWRSPTPGGPSASSINITYRWFRLFKRGMRLSMRLKNCCWSRE